jgi:DNA repair protein RadC
MTIAEKIATYGGQAATTAELLQLVAGVEGEGINIQEAIEAAFDAATTALRKAKLQAMKELIRRANIDTARKITIIHGPEDVARYLIPIFNSENDKKERFTALFLDTKNKVIKHEFISVGSQTASIVHPREVFAAAVKNKAVSIIIAHNHPSGDPSPSREDVGVTKRLIEAGKTLDIHVLDHIIVGNNSGQWVSLKEKGTNEF